MIDFLDLIQQAIKHDLWGVLFLVLYHFTFVRPWIKEVKDKNAAYQLLVQEKLGAFSLRVTPPIIGNGLFPPSVQNISNGDIIKIISDGANFHLMDGNRTYST